MVSAEKERSLLPLFPLHTVLFPGERMPLHVFEERYRIMLDHCLSRAETFGIVMIKSGKEVEGPAEPYMVGTEATITEYRWLNDGRCLLLVTGGRRFQIQQLDYRRPYLSAHVHWLIEDKSSAKTELKRKLLSQSGSYIAYLKTTNPSLDIRLDTEKDWRLSYQLANLLAIAPGEKQRLLELDDLEERVQSEIEILRVLLPDDKEPGYIG
jgi:Lon protease-like protein